MIRFTEAELIALETGFLPGLKVYRDSMLRQSGYGVELFDGRAVLNLTFESRQTFLRLIEFARQSGAVQPIPPMPPKSTAHPKSLNGLRASTQKQKRKSS